MQAAKAIANGRGNCSLADAMKRICVSPQCGFASHSQGNKVTEQDVAAKLRLVSQAAQYIWAN